MKNEIMFFILPCLLFINIAAAQECISGPLNISNHITGITDTIPKDKSAADIQREAIKKVNFLAGNWKGTHWLITQDGTKRNVDSYDFAESKLGGTVILFQGTMKVQIPGQDNPITVYEGLGLLSYNGQTGKYRLQHFGTNGSYEDYECTLTGTILLCEQTDKNANMTRVTIMVDEAGRWIEKGERSADGNSWQQYFETTMEIVKE